MYGLPLGGLSLWSGSAGVGKSRTCIAIASRINEKGFKVLYIQNEVDPGQFREWTKNQVPFADNFFVHTSDNVADHIAAIKQIRPILVIVDSLTMIANFRSPVVIRKSLKAYKQAVVRYPSHGILVGHLNKAGTVKGNNDIEYLIDIECSLTHIEDEMPNPPAAFDPSGVFVLQFFKNRFGVTSTNGIPNYVCLRHTDTGIVFVCSNVVPRSEADIPLLRPQAATPIL
jgi:predicted ATP-dependent serine protease